MTTRRAWYASPYLLLTLTAFCWAANAVVARALHNDLPPIAMAFWRWTLACVVLFPFVARSIFEQRELIARNWLRLMVLGAVGVAGFNTLIYTALQTTTAINVLIIYSLTPISIVFLNWLLFSAPSNWKQQAGMVLSLIGVLAIICRGDLSLLAGLQANVGDLFALAGVLCWALYSVSLRWRPQGISGGAFLGITVMVGAILLLPLYLAEHAMGKVGTYNGPVLWGLVFFAVFPSALAYLFWNRGVQEVGANRAGLFIYVVPVFGALMSLLFLGEPQQLFHLVGALLIMGGFLMANSGNAPTHTQPPPKSAD